MFFYGCMSIYFLFLYYVTTLRFYQQTSHIYSENNFSLDFGNIKNDTHLPINPSIIYSGNEFWGTVRLTNDHKCVSDIRKEYTNEVHYIEKYKSVEVLNPGHLDWCTHVTFRRKGCEDPRSFVWNHKKYALVTVVGKPPFPCSNKIYLYNIELKTWIRIFSPFSNNKKLEKNWTPFIYNNDLYIEYFVNPRKVFNYLSNNKVEITLCPKMSLYLHGSVNPVQLKNNYYLGMAHTNPGYLHMFYLFEGRPPFRIIKFSSYFGIDRYNESQYEFVTGMSFVEKTNEIFISYTINDCANKMKIFPYRFIEDKLIYNC